MHRNPLYVSVYARCGQRFMQLEGELPKEALNFDSNALAETQFFVDAAKHDFRPRSEAPFIDRGEELEDTKWDRVGVRRPFGVRSDIGAYEWTGVEE